jgi:hypothetical protein
MWSSAGIRHWSPPTGRRHSRMRWKMDLSIRARHAHATLSWEHRRGRGAHVAEVHVAS